MAKRFAKRRVSRPARGGQRPRKDCLRSQDGQEELLPADPLVVLREAKTRVRLAAERLSPKTRRRLAYAFTDAVIDEYWRGIQSQYATPFSLPRRFARKHHRPLSDDLRVLARMFGRAATRLSPLNAGYFIGTTYAAMLSKEFRAKFGIYYTPPAVAARLLDQAAAAGIDWATCTALDPACGGGAFLAPLAERISKQLSHLEPGRLLEEIERRLRGWEIDPYAAWLSQTILEATVLPLCHAAGRRLAVIVDAIDSLRQRSTPERYDLVIGNPPYGRVTLSPNDREFFSRTLYGHANLYGVFTDISLRMLTEQGVLAFVTPTSFLAGQYFKRLRGILGEQAAPITLDFISQRHGVFDDVLQEALLATYRRGSTPVPAVVSFITPVDELSVSISSVGAFGLPTRPTDPWLIPRSIETRSLVKRLQHMPHRLRDWGYSVSTGPLVWNRHKKQFGTKREKGAFPVVWAEAVASNGEFIFRADRRGHQPYLRPRRSRDDWLIVKDQCVLLQRTTAKEQPRRLIAAVLSEGFIREHGGAIVENHLNMIRPIVKEPPVPIATVAAFLNSAIADQVFRCLNGSVAVSAYELEALPLPPPPSVQALQGRLDAAQSLEVIERGWRSLYADEGR